MKTATIHTNALGDVLNPTSATGFRIEDEKGRVVELRADNMTIRVGDTAVSIEYIEEVCRCLKASMGVPKHLM